MPTPEELERLKRMATETPPISVTLPEHLPTPSVIAAASRVPLARMLLIIATAGGSIAGVVTALGAQIVNIIQSLRPQSIAALRAELEPRLSDVEKRANADFGLKHEVTTRQDEDAKLASGLQIASSHAARCLELEKRVDSLEAKRKHSGP